MNDALLMRAKRAAAQRGVTLSRLVEMALRALLDAPTARERKRVPLPVSSATFQPGIDPTRNRTLWAQLEQEEH